MEVMSSRQEFLQDLYEAFNKKEIETIIAMLRPDVKWANGMKGGFVHGRDNVRDYWLEQFENIRGRPEPLKFETDETGRDVVSVHLTVHDREGNLLLEKNVRHMFTIEDGLISLFEMDDPEPVHDIIDGTRYSAK